MLRLRGILRERNAVESAALHNDQSDAAWYTMYRSHNTPSFLTTVSLPPDDFDDLLQVFDQEYTVLSGPGRRGRPPRIQHKHAVLAMTLHFYTAAVEHKTLQELFGVSPSTFARVLSNAERALGRSLNRIADAAVRWPTTRQQQHWATLTNAKEPLVEGVFAFVDGENYRVQSPSNIDLQNAQFNGRVASFRLRNGLPVLGVDGTIIWARHNCPGSWNDGEVSRQLQARLADGRYVGVEMKVASDSAFPVAGPCAGRIITPLKQGDLERQPPANRLALQTMSDCITSLRQAAEWGMGATGKVYRQLMLPLPYNPVLRGQRLSNMFRLYNFRVRRTGLSQIKNVFGA
ncbi:hypothetical protein AaE_011623 [Aphanomyces astaci]|uniref:DDE Tnp4 domain-containing protein n=1 Tax=Aphanomyces astaci TaxID=112090 RepID=A0A6A4ZNU8_APHAT|nr:hypothetical protein AaE_011623 [Aphanomyces astaci]